MNETVLQQVHNWIKKARNGQAAGFDERQLYAKLIVEENSELFQAIIQGNELKQLDGCVDTIWVLLGFVAVVTDGDLQSPNNLYIEHIWDDFNFSEYETFDYLVIAMNMKYGNFIEQYFEKGQYQVNTCVDYITNIIRYARFKGWDIKGAWDELVKSNNTKFMDDGRVKRDENGKIMKPVNYYKAPNFEPFLKPKGV